MKDCGHSRYWKLVLWQILLVKCLLLPMKNPPNMPMVKIFFEMCVTLDKDTVKKLFWKYKWVG